MEYIGTNSGKKSIATIENAGGGNVYVTTFGVPTYLSWTSGVDTLQICGCSALTSDCELRLFRYKRRRNGQDQGRTRKHGWHDCTDCLPSESRFVINGNGDVRQICRFVKDSLGLSIQQTPAEYQRTLQEGLSLKYRCAFAIFKNGMRVSDMMHFSVDKNGIYGSW